MSLAGVAAYLAFAGSLGSSSAVIAPGQGLGFEQLDFTFTLAPLPNSAWGVAVVDIPQMLASTGISAGYLNVRTDVGWVVQNASVEPSAYTQFRLSFELPVAPGTDVASLSAYAALSDGPLATFADGTRSNFAVNDAAYNADGAGDVATSGPGAGPPPRTSSAPAAGATKPPVKVDPTNVEAAKNQCFPMSIANSLQYLENSTGLPVPHDHVPGGNGATDDSLVGELDERCARVANEPIGFKAMLKAKFKYLADHGLAGQMAHHHQGHGYGNDQLQPNNYTQHGSTSIDQTHSGSGGQTRIQFEWIRQALANHEDVELCWKQGSGNQASGHVVRVVEAGETNGRKWIRYAHDREQGQAGGTVIEEATLKRNGAALFLHCENANSDLIGEVSFVMGEKSNCSAPDTDGDGVVDCIDGCPNDPNKTLPGDCGCNQPETDSDGDGVPDCADNCAWMPNFGQEDCDGDGAGDACELQNGTATDLDSNGVPDACQPGAAIPYCTAGTSLGLCTPTITTIGAPSIDPASLLFVLTTGNDGQRNGGFFFGISGVQATPFAAGFMCVAPPRQRTPVIDTGGQTGQCNGALFFELHKFATLNPGALGVPLAAGQSYFVQAYNRDSGSPGNLVMSNAIAITLAP